MRAALLRETVYVYKIEKTITQYGSEKKEYIHTHTIKAYRKKLSASVGNGISASEEFISNTLVLQVRKYSFLNEDVRIKYGNQFYNIVLLDPQPDNTFLITCSKVN